ncbi:MAG: ACT domain-containing protein [Ilumatobacteraceae bacterium]|nr:ACT domain-containing protein [Ilumatobacteraceae bacterium]
MPAERDLQRLLAGLRPRHVPGEFVYVTLPDLDPALAPLATVREAEGISHVIDRSVADAGGLAYDFVAGWITLDVASALDAVGLTAAVAAALTEAEISCNVLAGTHHDHLLVPADRVDEALAVLAALSGAS